MSADLLFYIYAAISWVLFLYAFNFYYLLYRSSRYKRPLSTGSADTDLPSVTVQLPIFNERYVANRLIASVCAFDYPKDRLQIQVLDDSTDLTRDLSQDQVNYWKRQGFMIEYLHRSTRSGFKAGALRHGLEKANGEFIAIFDADFLPPRNFLRQAVTRFNGRDVGLIQARWSHLNQDYSTLTRAQALNLDLHFLIEQRARSGCELFMNFNGTAGIWRKECIIDAGGWQDALAEDLDLSYRAQLRGWRLVFLDDISCPAELPVQVNAAKRQHFRWAKGAGECTVRLIGQMARAELGLKTKLQASLQLTRHVVHPLLILQFLLLPLLMTMRYDIFPVTAIVSQLLLGPIIYIFALHRFWGKESFRKLGDYTLLMLFSSGISLNNAVGFIEGLLGRKGPFLRTPKFAVQSDRDNWKDKDYVLQFPKLTLLELLLAVYGCVGIFAAIFSRNFLYLPYLLLATSGFVYIVSMTFKHSLKLGMTEEKEEGEKLYALGNLGHE